MENNKLTDLFQNASNEAESSSYQNQILKSIAQKDREYEKIKSAMGATSKKWVFTIPILGVVQFIFFLSLPELQSHNYSVGLTDLERFLFIAYGTCKFSVAGSIVGWLVELWSLKISELTKQNANNHFGHKGISV
jgi:hypothetical protein